MATEKIEMIVKTAWDKVVTECVNELSNMDMDDAEYIDTYQYLCNEEAVRADVLDEVYKTSVKKHGMSVDTYYENADSIRGYIDRLSAELRAMI